MKSQQGARPGGLWIALALAWLVPLGESAGGEDQSRQAAAESRDEAGQTEDIDRLIVQLGDDDYFVRERAQEELIGIGFEAFDALTAAEQNDDPEIAARAKYLVRLMRVDWSRGDDPAAVKELIREYEEKNDDDRSKAIRQLSALPNGEGLSALCRIVRFERSAALSKLAAVEILGQKPPDEEGWPAREATIRRGLGRSSRPGAEWLQAYLKEHADPEAAVENWSRIADAEEQLARGSPQQTRPEILTALRRHEIALLRRLDRRDEALAAMLKLVAREQGSMESLVELLEWLVEQQAWDGVDEVANRFAAKFDQDPFLLYVLADARHRQGNDALAEELVSRALKLNPTDQEGHRRLYVRLSERGWQPWAINELRKMIEIGPERGSLTMEGQIKLAELLHDQGDEQGAAEHALVAIKAMEDNIKDGKEDNNGRRLEPIRCWYHYYEACRLVSPGEVAKKIAQLEAAIEQDPTNADVLIALYRLPNPAPELRAKTMKLIREAADLFRQQIQQDPDDATPYNNLAWLIGNTEGDQQEALQASLKSLEIVRADPTLKSHEAGLLDTLGRCYYALGDYENAVKAQSRAVELNPHSGLMRKQLVIFREALEKKQLETKP